MVPDSNTPACATGVGVQETVVDLHGRLVRVVDTCQTNLRRLEP